MNPGIRMCKYTLRRPHAHLPYWCCYGSWPGLCKMTNVCSESEMNPIWSFVCVMWFGTDSQIFHSILLNLNKVFPNIWQFKFVGLLTRWQWCHQKNYSNWAPLVCGQCTSSAVQRIPPQGALHWIWGRTTPGSHVQVTSFTFYVRQ